MIENKLLRNGLVIFGAVMLVLVLLGYQFRDQFVVARVNGETITRLELIRELERQGRQQTLEGMVTRKLVNQRASQTGVSASTEEIDIMVEEIESSMEAQGQGLDQVLAMQRLSRSELREQLALEIMVEKMATADLTISEDELDKYMEDNQDFLPPGEDEEETRAQVESMLLQERRDQAIQAWIDALHQEASIVYY